MGNSALTIPNVNVIVQIKEGDKFLITYADLIDHILLLRKVIANPEMTQKGPILDYFIKDYCKRMAKQKMINKKQQLKLPWQIEWIWHVHRLHPVAYYNDCIKQLPKEELVDKTVYNMIKTYKKKTNSKIVFPSIRNHLHPYSRLQFVPSIDLVQAVIHQRDFLEKFKEHKLYSWIFTKDDREDIEQLVQNYVSFMKLARQNEIIVPTFDIDLIWHSHMRYPSYYHMVSKAICGFILDHDDSIEQSILSNNYQKTADQWKQIYNTDYGQNINRKNLQKSHYLSSCAMVLLPVFIVTSGGSSSYGAGGVDSTAAGGGGTGTGGGGGGGGGKGGGGSGGGGGGGEGIGVEIDGTGKGGDGGAGEVDGGGNVEVGCGVCDGGEVWGED